MVSPPLVSLLVWSPLGPEDPPGQVQPPAVCFPLRDLSPRASPPASRGGQVSRPWEQAGQERKCKQHIQRPAVSHWPRDMPPAGPKPPVLSHCAVGGGTWLWAHRGWAHPVFSQPSSCNSYLRSHEGAGSVDVRGSLLLRLLREAGGRLSVSSVRPRPELLGSFLRGRRGEGEKLPPC